MSQDHDDDGGSLIVDDAPALDFILYEEMTKMIRSRKEAGAAASGLLHCFYYRWRG